MNFSFRKIGLAIGFSPTSEAMLAEAARLTSLYQANLVLIHVGAHGKREEELMNNLLAKTGLLMAAVKICWENGKPADSILKVCHREKIDLLIAGALKKENLMSYYIGTIARKIMRKADCSFLMITNPKTESSSYKNIVVNAEDSPYVVEAISVACQLGMKEQSTWVHIVRELKMYGLTMATADQCTEEEYDDMRQHLVKDEIDKVEELLRKIPHDKLKVNIKMVSGKAGFELSKFAQRKNADLLIVGAPRRRFYLFDRVFPHDLEYIFGDMPCNLLVIHPKAEAERKEVSRG
jgi:nucleotide-binding universal stress UspA family protein